MQLGYHAKCVCYKSLRAKREIRVELFYSSFTRDRLQLIPTTSPMILSMTFLLGEDADHTRIEEMQRHN